MTVTTFGALIPHRIQLVPSFVGFFFFFGPGFGLKYVPLKTELESSMFEFELLKLNNCIKNEFESHNFNLYCYI